MDAISRNCQLGVPNKIEISSKKIHLIPVFKSFEATINDKKKKYFDKIQSLLTAWEQLAVFMFTPGSSTPQPEFESLFSHTLRSVLRADWERVSPATQTHLTVTLQRFTNGVNSSKKYPSILHKCRVLESIVKKPWKHPTLEKMFKNEEPEIEELLEYFQFEHGPVIVIRLEMLLESKCEDIALILSKLCLLTINNSHPLELDFNQNEVDYITDIYFCTLLREKKKPELSNEIRLYDLADGLQLLKRYNKHSSVAAEYNNHCKDARVWRYSNKLMEFIGNTLLVNAVVHEFLVDSEVVLSDLIAEWAIVHKNAEEGDVSRILLEMIQKCVLSAGSSKCIYPFCSYLIKNCVHKESYLNFVAKCLIRAVNYSMNEIESYRVSRNYDQLKATYEELSQGFVLISKLFSDYKNIYRECLLTSFSLIPTREKLEELEAFIDKSTAEANEKLAAASTNENCSSSDDQVVPESSNNGLTKVPTSETVPDSVHVPVAEIVPDLSTEKCSEENIIEGAQVHNCEGNGESNEKIIVDKVPLPNGLENLERGNSLESTPTCNDLENRTVGQRSEAEEPVIESNCSKNDHMIELANRGKNMNLLSMQTDTKLKMDGVEEIIKVAAPAYCMEVESLHLDESMKMDLSSVLRYQRFRSLSWDLDWSELKVNCENFLEMFEKRGFDEVELKYLDLDYSQFKDKPINEEDYIGIEKGYEHYAEGSWDDVVYDPYNRWSTHSSYDSDDDYDGVGRKKMIHRTKLKKTKAKLKSAYYGSSDDYDGSDAEVTRPRKKYTKKRSAATNIDDSDISASDYEDDFDNDSLNDFNVRLVVPLQKMVVVYTDDSSKEDEEELETPASRELNEELRAILGSIESDNVADWIESVASQPVGENNEIIPDSEVVHEKPSTESHEIIVENESLKEEIFGESQEVVPKDEVVCFNDCDNWTPTPQPPIVVAKKRPKKQDGQEKEKKTLVIKKPRVKKDKTEPLIKRPRGRPRKDANLLFPGSSSVPQFPPGANMLSPMVAPPQPVGEPYLKSYLLNPSPFNSISYNNPPAPPVPTSSNDLMNCLNYSNNCVPMNLVSTNANDFSNNVSTSWNPNYVLPSYPGVQTHYVQTSTPMYVNAPPPSMNMELSSGFTQTDPNVVSQNHMPICSYDMSQSMMQQPSIVPLNTIEVLQPVMYQQSPNLMQQSYINERGDLEGNIEAVQQILGTYKELVHKFPDVPHNTGSRKGTVNGVRRPRKPKKDIDCIAGDGDPELQKKVKRVRKTPKKNVSVLSTDTSMLNGPSMVFPIQEKPTDLSGGIGVPEEDVDQSHKLKLRDLSVSLAHSLSVEEMFDPSPILLSSEASLQSNGQLISEHENKVEQPDGSKGTDVTSTREFQNQVDAPVRNDRQEGQSTFQKKKNQGEKAKAIKRPKLPKIQQPEDQGKQSTIKSRLKEKLKSKALQNQVEQAENKGSQELTKRDAKVLSSYLMKACIEPALLTKREASSASSNELRAVSFPNKNKCFETSSSSCEITQSSQLCEIERRHQTSISSLEGPRNSPPPPLEVDVGRTCQLKTNCSNSELNSECNKLTDLSEYTSESQCSQLKKELLNTSVNHIPPVSNGSEILSNTNSPPNDLEQKCLKTSSDNVSPEKTYSVSNSSETNSILNSLLRSPLPKAPKRTRQVKKKAVNLPSDCVSSIEKPGAGQSKKKNKIISPSSASSSDIRMASHQNKPPTLSQQAYNFEQPTLTTEEAMKIIFGSPSTNVSRSDRLTVSPEVKNLKPKRQSKKKGATISSGSSSPVVDVSHSDSLTESLQVQDLKPKRQSKKKNATPISSGSSLPVADVSHSASLTESQDPKPKRQSKKKGATPISSGSSLPVADVSHSASLTESPQVQDLKPKRQSKKKGANISPGSSLSEVCSSEVNSMSSKLSRLPEQQSENNVMDPSSDYSSPLEPPSLVSNSEKSPRSPLLSGQSKKEASTSASNTSEIDFAKNKSPKSPPSKELEQTHQSIPPKMSIHLDCFSPEKISLLLSTPEENSKRSQSSWSPPEEPKDKDISVSPNCDSSAGCSLSRHTSDVDLVSDRPLRSLQRSRMNALADPQPSRPCRSSECEGSNMDVLNCSSNISSAENDLKAGSSSTLSSPAINSQLTRADESLKSPRLNKRDESLQLKESGVDSSFPVAKPIIVTGAEMTSCTSKSLKSLCLNMLERSGIHQVEDRNTDTLVSVSSSMVSPEIKFRPKRSRVNKINLSSLLEEESTEETCRDVDYKPYKYPKTSRLTKHERSRRDCPSPTKLVVEDKDPNPSFCISSSEISSALSNSRMGNKSKRCAKSSESSEPKKKDGDQLSRKNALARPFSAMNSQLVETPVLPSSSEHDLSCQTQNDDSDLSSRGASPVEISVMMSSPEENTCHIVPPKSLHLNKCKQASPAKNKIIKVSSDSTPLIERLSDHSYVLPSLPMDSRSSRSRESSCENEVERLYPLKQKDVNLSSNNSGVMDTSSLSNMEINFRTNGLLKSSRAKLEETSISESSGGIRRPKLVEKNRRVLSADSSLPAEKPSEQPSKISVLKMNSPYKRSAPVHENGVLNKTPPNTKHSAIINNRFPIVVIPECKMLTELLLRKGTTLNLNTTVESIEPRQKERACGETKEILIVDCDSEVQSPPVRRKPSELLFIPRLTDVEVRVPTISQSQIRNYIESKKNTGTDSAALAVVSDAPSKTDHQNAKIVKRRRKSVIDSEVTLSDPLEVLPLIDPSTRLTAEKDLPDTVDGEVSRARKSRKQQNVDEYSGQCSQGSSEAQRSPTSRNEVPVSIINASTPKTLSEGYSVIAVPDINNVSTAQLLYQNQFLNKEQSNDQVQKQSPSIDGDSGPRLSDVRDGSVILREYLCDSSAKQRKSSSSQNFANASVKIKLPQSQKRCFSLSSSTNPAIAGDDNNVTCTSTRLGSQNGRVNIQYSKDSSSEPACISIPENAIDESFLGNYLAFIRNTTISSDSLPPNEQNVSLHASNNDVDNLIQSILS